MKGLLICGTKTYGEEGAFVEDYETATSIDFGDGKANTTTMITRWNNDEYGQKSDSDIWGAIQDEVDKGWFVPSKGEWGAFADNLMITSENYPDYGIYDTYWSSSMEDPYIYTNIIFGTFFNPPSSGMLSIDSHVRLSTSF